jgi:hypothetical protein
MGLDVQAMTISAVDHEEVTPDDNVVYDPPLRALFSRQDCTVVLVDRNDRPIAYPVLASQRIDLFIKKVMETGTTAASTFIGQR